MERDKKVEIPDAPESAEGIENEIRKEENFFLNEIGQKIPGPKIRREESQEKTENLDNSTTFFVPRKEEKKAI